MMQDWLRIQAKAHPRRPALILAERVWTFAQLDAEVDAWAAGLQVLGVQPGQRVAFWRVPKAQAVRLVWAVARVGAVLVPLHDRWTETEIQQALALTRPHLVLGPEGMAQAVPWSAVPEAGAQRPPKTVPRHPVQGLVFTSGSTGRIKAAVLTWHNHFWSAWASATRLGLLPEDAWLLNLPLYHIGGLAILWRCMLYGIPVVLPPEAGSFQPETLADMATWPRRPSLLSLVPTMLYRLVEAGQRPWPEVRVVLVGGAAAASDLVRAALDLGWPIALTYGLTEAASQVATATPDLVRRKPETVGHPLPFTQVVLRNAEGRPVPPGQVGEITVRGPMVFAGYWGNHTATARARRSGWLFTGDEGILDEEGHLRVLGRQAFCINTGGEKVYPNEVEATLLAHPAVAEACVVGIPDPEWGQKVAAAVVLRPGCRVTPSELEAWCRSRLAAYKCPRAWRILPALPRLPSGKIDRRRVQHTWPG